MYVCLCKGITDKQIVKAVENGAVSVRELRKQFGLGNQCGKCTCMARGVLNEALENTSVAATPAQKPEIFIPGKTANAATNATHNAIHNAAHNVTQSYFTLTSN
ncbi:hypothetical protein CWE08_06930 [Aliidiomarina iranensis]|uniref:Bacterioferritin-associated ferredoxin n=1 Tax=Aliidiomarina iranensis TaxID=1434071 RepID=A0A432VW48_9GAMM|nr:hypothetical protein CWE08_06930 [Aliidiomarina iranensis]